MGTSAAYWSVRGRFGSRASSRLASEPEDPYHVVLDQEPFYPFACFAEDLPAGCSRVGDLERALALPGALGLRAALALRRAPSCSGADGI